MLTKTDNKLIPNISMNSSITISILYIVGGTQAVDIYSRSMTNAKHKKVVRR
ncbi:hypothetical protein HC864_00360 [Candidatus Gracilibacteria bacterium]|nr:hypothetical protein [Candidatus Gracilibacteria bacterium]